MHMQAKGTTDYKSGFTFAFEQLLNVSFLDRSLQTNEHLHFYPRSFVCSLLKRTLIIFYEGHGVGVDLSCFGNKYFNR